MSTLTEFLKGQARKEPEILRIEQKRNDWTKSVTELMGQMKSWLEESDKDTQVLDLRLVDGSKSEEELGSYSVPYLFISLKPHSRRRVRIEPVARNVIGGVDEGGIHVRASGRVDVTNGVDKFILYRTSEHPDEWKLVDPDRLTVRNFDRQTFEAAVQSLLE